MGLTSKQLRVGSYCLCEFNFESGLLLSTNYLSQCHCNLIVVAHFPQWIHWFVYVSHHLGMSPFKGGDWNQCPDVLSETTAFHVMWLEFWFLQPAFPTSCIKKLMWLGRAVSAGGEFLLTWVLQSESWRHQVHTPLAVMEKTFPALFLCEGRY